MVAEVAEEEACVKDADARTGTSSNYLVGEHGGTLPVTSLRMKWPLGNSKDAIPTFTVGNTIVMGSRVRGDLSGPGGFRVDGALEGRGVVNLVGVAPSLDIHHRQRRDGAEVEHVHGCQ